MITPTNLSVTSSQAKTSLARLAKESDKNKDLNIYLANLHNYLGNYCFISGAYVVEDDESGSLFTFIKSFNPKLLNFRFFKTHTGFMNDKTKENLYECDIHLILNCYGCYGKNGDIIVRNLKWYPFTQLVNQVNKKYVYIKLEGYQTVSFDHAHRATKIYLLKQFRYKEDTCPTRRENCDRSNDTKVCTNQDDQKYKDEGYNGNKDPNKCDAKACRIPLDEASEKHNFKSFQIAQGPEFEIKENYNRLGDEFFVPYAVSKHFLDKRGNLMSFTHSDNKVYITEGPVQTIVPQTIVPQNPITGGKSKKKKSKRKGKRIKSKKRKILFSVKK